MNAESRLTNHSAFIVLVRVKLAFLVWSTLVKIDSVVGLHNHIVLVGDFLLFEGSLEYIPVCVVFKLH